MRNNSTTLVVFSFCIVIKDKIIKLTNSWQSNRNELPYNDGEKEEICIMKATVFIAYILLLMYFVVGVAFIYLFVLLVRALKKYIKSEPVRKEKAESAKSLGEVIKRYRTQRKMTQEFVAESLGVTRQAVSKWESGASDPSTTNLMALAKLFGVTAEEILKEVK